MKPEALERLRKICGLLGSDQDGERANAARMATDLLKENGLTWADISVGLSAPTITHFYGSPPPTKREGRPPNRAENQTEVELLREGVNELIGRINRGEVSVTARTAQFLRSVAALRHWTKEEMAAVETCLGWA